MVNMNRQKYVLCMRVVTIMLLCGLLAACGGTANNAGTGGSTATATPAPTPTSTAGQASGAAGCAGQGGLLSIRMLDSFHGWALNEHAILKTSDGGEHWSCVTPPNTTVGRSAGEFLDARHAWVALQPQSDNTITILRTTDGGQSWQSSTITASQPEVGDPPRFINTREGWFEPITNGGPGAGSESVDIFHTTDGGQNWSKVASTDDPNSGLPRGGIKSGLSFRNSQNGWAAGEDASTMPWLYVTHNGGKTWKRQLLPDLPGAIGTASTSVQYGTTPPVFFGDTGLLPVQVVGQLDQGAQSAVHGFLLYTTADGGQSWTTSWKTNPATLTAFTTTSTGLYIADPLHGWANNNQDGSLYGTSDGGQSWHKLAADVGQVASMSFVDTSTGWIASDKGLLHTTDGGKTWQQVHYAYP